MTPAIAISYQLALSEPRIQEQMNPPTFGCSLRQIRIPSLSRRTRLQNAVSATVDHDAGMSELPARIVPW